MATIGDRPTRNDDVEGNLDELFDLLEEFSTAMLVTLDAAGYPRARPMELLRAEGELWFATSDLAPKVEELRRDAKVAAVFLRERDHAWISVSGVARTMHDAARARAMWNPAMSSWLSGPEDPHLLLVHVDPVHAEYFEPSMGAIGRALEIVRGALVRHTLDYGPVHHVDARDLTRLSDPLEGMSARASRPSAPGAG